MRQQKTLRHRVTLQSPTRIRLQARYSGGSASNFDKLDNSTTGEEIDIKTYHSASGGCAEAFNAVTPVLSKFTIFLTSAIRVPALYKPSRVLPV
jgi:hypothetical protein